MSAAVIVTLCKSWPNRPQLWLNSLRPNYGLTSTDANLNSLNSRRLDELSEFISGPYHRA